MSDIEIADYLSTTGELSRRVPIASRLFNCFYFPNETLRPQFIRHEYAEEDDKKVVPIRSVPSLSFKGDDGKLLPDFQDIGGNMIELFHEDGSFVMAYEQTTEAGTSKSSTSMSDEMRDAINLLATNTARMKAVDSLPSLEKWKPSPKTWKPWRHLAESRFNRMKIQPPIKGLSMPCLSADDDATLYDEINTHILINDTDHSRQVRLFLRTYIGSGTKVWNEMIAHFEKDHDRRRVEIKDAMKTLRLGDFIHKQHPSIYNVSDFFTTLGLRKLDLDDAGGDWTDEDHLELIEKAFEKVEQWRKIRADIIFQYGLRRSHLNGQVMQDELLRYYVLLLPRSSREHDETDKPTNFVQEGAGNSERNKITCKDCGKLGHNTKNSPKCQLHVADDATRGTPRQNDKGRDPKQPNQKQPYQYAKEQWLEFLKENKSKFAHHGEYNKCHGCGEDKTMFFKCKNAACVSLHKKLEDQFKAKHPPPSTSSPTINAAAASSLKSKTSEGMESKSKAKFKGVGFPYEAIDISKYENVVGEVLPADASDPDRTRRSLIARSLLKIDNCANRDVSPFIEDFIELRQIEQPEEIVGMYGGNTPKLIGTTVYFVTDEEGDVCPLRNTDVIYDPKSTARIKSARKMADNGWDLQLFRKTGTYDLAILRDEDGDHIVTLPIHNINDLSQMVTCTCPDDPSYDEWRLQLLTAVPEHLLSEAVTTKHCEDCIPTVNALHPRDHEKTLWHLRMGHLGDRILDMTRAHHAVTDLNWPENQKLSVCPSCAAGKARAAPVKKATDTPVLATKGERMYSDTSGKLSVPSKGGGRYTATILDDHSRTTHVTGLVKKSHVTDWTDAWFDEAKTGDNADIIFKGMMTDGDPSNYGTPRYKSMLNKRGTQDLKTPQYVSAYAGKIERAQQTLDSMALAMLEYAGLDYSWYIAAYIFASAIRNRAAASAIDDDIPWHRWSPSSKILHRFIRIFGCPAYVTIPDRKRVKHQTKSWTGMYVGIADNGYGFKIYDPISGKTYDRINVTFDEYWRADLTQTNLPLHPTVTEEPTNAVNISDSDSEDSVDPQQDYERQQRWHTM